MSEETAPKPSETPPQPETLLTQGDQPEPAQNETEPSTEGETTVEPGAEPFDIEKFSLPEGFTLADDAKAALTETATKYGLTQAAMQDLTNLHVKAMTDAQTAAEAAWTTTQKEWTDAVFAKYGGEEGAKQMAAKFAPIIDQFGGQELRDALNVTGFGNNPAAFAFFAKIAEKFGEATPVAAAAAPKASANPLHAMYPTMVPKE